MSFARLANHQHFLYCTDLEPDDIVSIMMFVDQISKQAQSATTPIKIAFLAGEGDSRIKLARMQKLIQQYQELGMLKNTEIIFIQGYSDFYGAQKEFKADGEDVLDAEQIATAVSTLPDGNDEKTKQAARDAVKQFLAANDNTLVISIKPMRELQDIANADSPVFCRHTLACTGSYNFRQICWSRDEAEKARLQGKLVNMLQVFAACFVYESHSTTEANSTSNLNAREFFELLAQANDNTILGGFRIFIANWKLHLLNFDRTDLLPKALAKLEKVLTAEQRQLFVQLINQDYTEQNNGSLRAMIAMIKATHAEDKELLKTVQGLERILGKWKSITQAAMQFVNSDPGLLAILSGSCDATVSVQPAKISFAGDYTKLAPRTAQDTQAGNVFVYLPGADMTVERYLALRSQQTPTFKPAELSAKQAALLEDIHQAILAVGKKIHALTYLREHAESDKPSRLARMAMSASHPADAAEADFSVQKKF